MLLLLLTLKWSRGGSLWTLKSVFAHQHENAEYPDAAVSRLLHAYHPASSGMCLKKFAPRCAAIALGSLWTPHWPPTGRHSTKIIFHIHVTFDLWWLYINVDLWYYHISILIKINQCFINHLHADIYFYPYSYTTCTPPCTKWMGKSAGKNTKMNKTFNFFAWNILLDLYSTQNNHQLKFLVHQNGENAKTKWSLFRQNDATWKLMFFLYFLNRTLFFSFSFVNIDVLE